MSVITSFRTRIRLGEPGFESFEDLQHDEGFKILREAVEACAKDHGGRLVDGIRDYFGRFQVCDLAFEVPEFDRGIGIMVNRVTGEVFFLYDAYGGYDKTVSDLCGEVTQNFTALALASAFRSLNYRVEYEESADEDGRKTVVVRAVT